MASEDKERLDGVLYGISTVIASIDKKIKILDYTVTDMQKYMNMKRDLGDWHAVMDAAADIRELIAEKNGISSIKAQLEKLL